jgi:hypothetical protein
VDGNDDPVDMAVNTRGHYGREADFAPMILENPETIGIRQASKESWLAFTSSLPVAGPIRLRGRAVRRKRRRGRRRYAPEEAHGDQVMKVILV